MENYSEKIDKDIKGIPCVLNDFSINAPVGTEYSCNKAAAWIVAAVLVVASMAFVTVYMVCANGLCEKSCNNLVFVSMFVLGFATVVILALLKLLMGMRKQANEKFNKHMEVYNSYRKMMVERKIKDEDELRKLYFDSLKKKA